MVARTVALSPCACEVLSWRHGGAPRLTVIVKASFAVDADGTLRPLPAPALLRGEVLHAAGPRGDTPHPGLRGDTPHPGLRGDTPHPGLRGDTPHPGLRGDTPHPGGGPEAARVFRAKAQDPALDAHLDHRFIAAARPALESGSPVRIEAKVTNSDRSVGTRLSGEVARRGGGALVDDTIHIRLEGSAGQSFGAFLSAGITLELEGDTNDYLGKGLSGGHLIVYPPKQARYATQDNIIAGNVVLYGATSGAAYIAGVAGERFAVRNSGARAVVEGVSDHGCEYMTGGVVVVLGHTGKNFAAGMSGGMAFVFDRERRLAERLNRDMVEISAMVDQSDTWLVYGMIEDHVRHTRSTHARRILDNWELMVPHFVKVMPTEYRRALERRRSQRPADAPSSGRQLKVV